MNKRVFNKSAERRIESIIKASLALMGYDEEVRIQYGYVGDGVFQSKEIGAVNREPALIIVNVDWYVDAEERDMKRILRHEARHLYQRSQVRKFRQGLPFQVPRELVAQWMVELGPAYISNTPGTALAHFRQACELDAYTYAMYLDAIEHSNNEGYDLQIVEYPGIGEEIKRRVEMMLNVLPPRTRKLYKERLRG